MEPRVAVVVSEGQEPFQIGLSEHVFPQMLCFPPTMQILDARHPPNSLGTTLRYGHVVLSIAAQNGPSTYFTVAQEVTSNLSRFTVSKI